MSSNTFAGSNSELDVVECLTIGLRSPFKEFEGLLGTLEDVNMNAVGQSTLLHLGVKMGKLDWVEGLLGEGADPGSRGGGQKTALEMAEELGRRYPEDMDRKDILRFIRLVHKRENAIKRRRALYGGDDLETSLTDFSHEMAVLSAFEESIHSLTKEMTSLRRQIAEEVDEMRKAFTLRDVVMDSLVKSMTSSSELLRELVHGVKETLDARNIPSPSLSPEDVRGECIDGMMGRTSILNSDKEKEQHVRGLYEKLYDESEMTSCVLLFLNSQTGFSVMVDCDSYGIGKMKAKFTNHDGVEWSGSGWRSHADFSEMRVYIGGKVGGNEKCVLGVFAWALAQMSNLLAFRNGGLPYVRGDGLHEREMRRALEEAKEEKRKRGEGLHNYIRCVLGRKTQLGKEIELASVVPLIIALYGSTEGTSLLRDQVPSLLKLYEEHVMTTLLNKARLRQENEELSSLVMITKENQDRLTTELADFKERYGEVICLLTEAQENLRKVRQKELPSALAGNRYLAPPITTHHSLQSHFGDSIALELESSLNYGLSLDSGIHMPAEVSPKAPHYRKVLETVRSASRSSSSPSPSPLHHRHPSLGGSTSSSAQMSTTATLSSASSSQACRMSTRAGNAQSTPLPHAGYNPPRVSSFRPQYRKVFETVRSASRSSGSPSPSPLHHRHPSLGGSTSSSAQMSTTATLSLASSSQACRMSTRAGNAQSTPLPHAGYNPPRVSSFRPQYRKVFETVRSASRSSSSPSPSPLHHRHPSLGGSTSSFAQMSTTATLSSASSSQACRMSTRAGNAQSTPLPHAGYNPPRGSPFSETPRHLYGALPSTGFHSLDSTGQSEESDQSEMMTDSEDCLYPDAVRDGIPGSPGAKELQAALARIAKRQQMSTPQLTKGEKAIGGYEGKSRDSSMDAGSLPRWSMSSLSSVQQQQLPYGCRTPDSIMSTGSSRGSGRSWRMPEKLQIVKPLEGSLTLGWWSRLATPSLSAALEERPGVKVRGGTGAGDAGVTQHTLMDLEEDDSVDSMPASTKEMEPMHPGKFFQGTGSVYTYTNSTVLHPDNTVPPSPKPQSPVTSSPSQPTPLLSRRSSISTATPTFSTALGLAKMLRERGISASSSTEDLQCSGAHFTSATATPCNSPDESATPTRSPSPELFDEGDAEGNPIASLISSGAELLRRSLAGSLAPIPPRAALGGGATRRRHPLSRSDRKALVGMKLVEKLERIGLEAIVANPLYRPLQGGLVPLTTTLQVGTMYARPAVKSPMAQLTSLKSTLRSRSVDGSESCSSESTVQEVVVSQKRRRQPRRRQDLGTVPPSRKKERSSDSAPVTTRGTISAIFFGRKGGLM